MDTIASATVSLCVIVILLTIGIIVFFYVVLNSDDTKEYKKFLEEHEGIEFFCYTDRKNSKQFIEQNILPHLDPSIEVIHLEGKKPISRFEEEYISFALYRIKQVGFPNLMKIKNGRMVDVSLHHELYNTINQGKSPDEFLMVLNEKLGRLRIPEQNG